MALTHRTRCSLPYEIKTFTLPGGARCACLDGFGRITKDDAEYLIAQVGPGGPLHGLPVLALTQRMESLSPEARNLIAGRQQLKQWAWCAVVVTNPIMRVTSSFMMRILKVATTTKLFANEAEATQWLDERVREGAPGAKAGTP